MKLFSRKGEKAGADSIKDAGALQEFWNSSPGAIMLRKERAALFREKIAKWTEEERRLLDGRDPFNVDVPLWQREFIRGAQDWAVYCHVRRGLASTLISNGSVKRPVIPGRGSSWEIVINGSKTVVVDQRIMWLAWFAVNDYNATGGENIQQLR